MDGEKMELEDISKKYKENIENFLKNKEVIEQIYKEQYGEEEYNKNKDMYNEQYKEIIENTVVIPYITLEHLENVLVSIGKTYGKEYVEENYKNEVNLARKLIIKKDEIVKEYTKQLLVDLQNKKIKIINFKELEEKLGNNVTENIQNIKQHTKENIIGIIGKYKERKLDKLLNIYEEDVKNKVLIETSTFFKHMRDIPKNKFSVDLVKIILGNESGAPARIGKEKNKNCRYIYIPILKYCSKEEYLKDVIHEAMHISKEKILGKKHRRGLNELKILRNTNGQMYVPFSLNLINSLKYKKIQKQFGLPKKRRHERMDNEIFEEVVHHKEVRNVTSKLKKNGLDKLLEMQYRVHDLGNKLGVTYECADNVTEKFINNFHKYTRKINSATMKIQELKKCIGNGNYYTFARLMNEWIRGVDVKPSNNMNNISIYSKEDLLYYEAIKYENAAEIILENMNKKAKKYNKQVEDRISKNEKYDIKDDGKKDFKETEGKNLKMAIKKELKVFTKKEFNYER